MASKSASCEGFNSWGANREFARLFKTRGWVVPYISGGCTRGCGTHGTVPRGVTHFLVLALPLGGIAVLQEAGMEKGCGSFTRVPGDQPTTDIAGEADTAHAEDDNKNACTTCHCIEPYPRGTLDLQRHILPIVLPVLGLTIHQNCCC